MSEIKKSSIFSHLITPSKIKFELQKIEDDLWEGKYSEWITLEDKKILAKTMKSTQKLIGALGFKLTRRGCKVSLAYSGPLSQLISVLVVELISLSVMGDLTLRDLIILAGMGKQLQSTMSGLPSTAPPPTRPTQPTGTYSVSGKNY